MRPLTSTRRYFIGGSDARVFLHPWRDMLAEVGRDDLPLSVAPKDPNRHPRQAITCRMPIVWQFVAVCYAAAAIFLGWWPWNLFLLLLLFPVRNKRVRFYEFRTVAAKESMRRRESYRRRSPT